MMESIHATIEWIDGHLLFVPPKGRAYLVSWAWDSTIHANLGVLYVSKDRADGNLPLNEGFIPLSWHLA